MRHFLFKAIALMACLWAQSSAAGCTGSDLRAGLSPQSKAQLDSRIAARSFSKGNHWRATRGPDTVHLIGTIHVHDPRLDAISERLSAVIETSEHLLVEVTPQEMKDMVQRMSTEPGLMFMQDATLPELMKETDWQRLMEAMRARGVPPVLGSRMQPWHLSSLLSTPPCLTDLIRTHPEKGLDYLLINQAEAAQIPISSLEAPDTLFKIFGQRPLHEQVKSLVLSLESDLGSEDAFATLLAAYFEQDHGAAFEMNRQQVLDLGPEKAAQMLPEVDLMESHLLTLRNQAWIPVILDHLGTVDVLTVAAGAGHLSGAQGLLALLQAEGFTLERMPF